MKKYTLLFLVIFCVFKSFGQDPNWSFNVNDYQYNMTFTTFLNVNGATLSSPNDKVAAFVNNEVRGVSSVTYVASENKYVAYLTVFANTNNETISFKIYDSTNDAVVTVDKTINFKINENVGGVFQSFSLAKPALKTQAEITDFSFKNIQEISSNINQNSIDVLLPSSTSINNLIADFVKSDGATVFVNRSKQLSGISAQNFTNVVTYQVLSEDQTTLREYTVNVKTQVIVSAFIVNLTSTANPLVKENPVKIQVQANDAITTLKIDDFLLNNAAIQTINKVSATVYEVILVAILQGDFSIEIPQNSIFNSNSIGNNASNKLSFTYNFKQPYLLSIKRKIPTSEITSADSVSFTAVFSEAVNNVSQASFLTVANATIAVEKVNDTTFTITVSNIENYEGAVSVSLNTTNSIADSFGNALRTSNLKNY